MDIITKENNAVSDNGGTTYTLRPYQKECKKTIEEAGEGRHLVVLATGMGKTMVFTHLDGMGRTLILSHRDELVRQPEKYYKGRKTFGVEKAGDHAEAEEIVSASVQSLSQDSRLLQYSPDAFETIIIDEAHHAAAKTYQKILDYFTGTKRRIGFTATPKRGDGVRLDTTFDKIIFLRDLRWGIENHFLSPIRCERVSGGYKLSGVTKQNGDYSASQVTQEMEDSETVQIAAKAYVEKCHNRGKHTILYCVSKKLCFLIQGVIREMLPKKERDTIQVVTGDTPDEERTQILSDFQDGKVKCIINCMILTEGTDLPICDTIINLRPTCNDSLYQQMVGRGTRLYDGKEYCLVLDIIPEDISVRHDLCTATSLFGVDASMLDKKSQAAINESVDLMELCNSLSVAYASAAQRLQLAYHSVNLFMDEVEELKNQSHSISEFARNYSQAQDQKNSDFADYDFGNLNVQIQADESRYYKFTPSWHEKVYLSKPDAMEMTTITIETKKDGEPYCYQGQMKMQEAIDLIKAYCGIKSDASRYAWDKTMQDSWRTKEATDAQMSRVRRERPN